MIRRITIDARTLAHMLTPDNYTRTTIEGIPDGWRIIGMTPAYDLAPSSFGEKLRGVPMLSKAYVLISDDPKADVPQMMTGLTYWSRLVDGLDEQFVTFEARSIAALNEHLPDDLRFPESAQPEVVANDLPTGIDAEHDRNA